MQFWQKSQCSLIDVMTTRISRFTSKTLSRSLSGTTFFLAATVLLFTSCKKEGNLGGDILPSDEVINLNATDSTSLLTYTVKEDSIRSDEAPTIQIGSIDDAVVGKTTAGLYAQFVIPNNLNNIDFGSGALLDSAVLCLSYAYDFYGDTTTQQTFNVYQMTQDIYYDSAYYSNSASQYYPTAVGTKSFSPRPRTQTVVGADTTAPHLRIPIDAGFAQQIFSQSGGANLASSASFVQYMKGLYIASENLSGTGALIHFNPLDSLTKFVFYYHNSVGPSSFSFVINSTAAYYSHFTHDYSFVNSDLAAQLSNPGVNTTNEVFIQAGAVLKVKIDFPFLDDWKNLPYKIAINKAELVVKADPSFASANFPIDKELYLVSVDTSGLSYLLPDMFENTVYYGGSVNTVTNEYRINIARYFQRLLNGEETHTKGLFLKEFSPILEGRRAVLGSSNVNSGYRMYLHLVYTRIN
jgi:hypothetical protein